MPDSKISNLTELTTPLGGDSLPIVNGGSTKRATLKNLRKIEDSSTTDKSISGTLITLTANENQTFGDACYINTDGEAQIADASAIATASAIVMCADATISGDASGNYLLFGTARDDDGWDWTVGGLIYLSITGTTTNTLTQTAPSSTDEVVQILGIATHADRMIFKPSLIQVEHT